MTCNNKNCTKHTGENKNKSDHTHNVKCMECTAGKRIAKHESEHEIKHETKHKTKRDTEHKSKHETET